MDGKQNDRMRQDETGCTIGVYTDRASGRLDRADGH